jgi:hypothetical protein
MLEPDAVAGFCALEPAVFDKVRPGSCCESRGCCVLSSTELRLREKQRSKARNGMQGRLLNVKQ